YLAPLLAASEAPRRLYDLEFRAFSNIRHDRLLDGVETDERRSGAGLTLGSRLLNLKAPHALRLSAGIRYESTSLENSALAQEAEDLTFLRLGAIYEWRHTYRWPSLTARVAPSVDLAYAVAGGDRSFVRPGIEATLHQRFLNRWESHFNFTGGTLDRHVPSFEQWSLGGEATLRGFSEDAFLGRHMAALQSEIWMPLFYARSEGAPSLPAPEPRVSRFLKGVVFMDAGTISGTSEGSREGALGAGVGLRFFVPRNPLVLKLDYGWGFGAPEEGSHFYFSLGYRP
ncbi:MAG TPA: BamA/TamA family outer membrane protein, partial [Candidatus Polarisedimenticolia bacterium]|nr:BamA/TamA family outer membrane protein [Candidatus Polarisedimenticolia bacterium]